MEHEQDDLAAAFEEGMRAGGADDPNPFYDRLGSEAPKPRGPIEFAEDCEFLTWSDLSPDEQDAVKKRWPEFFRGDRA